jgi:hypothetical protein
MPSSKIYGALIHPFVGEIATIRIRPVELDIGIIASEINEDVRQSESTSAGSIISRADE